MRLIVSLFLFTLFSITCVAQESGAPCPPEGTSISDIGKRINIMKNRDVTPGTVNTNITIDTLLKGMPEDTGRFKPNEMATITGYVLGADDAGPEPCNCFSKDTAKHNVLLYIGHSLEAGKDSVFVVEITSKYKNANHNFNSDALFGKEITVTGYLMYNFDMKKYALNACKK
ncbi:MAG TPA: hypothetical protein VN922_11440, partial [Bacteroidia bacterium]|nr:hypothetical protein [Bacteroidia bacterium]